MNAKGANADGKLFNLPTLVEYQNLRFLIMDAPNDGNINLYLKELKKHGVTDIVRVCQPTYSKVVVEQNNITVHDWPFEDGEPPTQQIVTDWLQLVESRFYQKQTTAAGATTPPSCIATHCVAGLGRAPVLVAIALIERGMAPLDSVAYVRERRRGAINNRQLKFLESYKRRSNKNKCIIC